MPAQNWLWEFGTRRLNSLRAPLETRQQIRAFETEAWRNPTGNRARSGLKILQLRANFRVFACRFGGKKGRFLGTFLPTSPRADSQTRVAVSSSRTRSRTGPSRDGARAERVDCALGGPHERSASRSESGGGSRPPPRHPRPRPRAREARFCRHLLPKFWRRDGPVRGPGAGHDPDPVRDQHRQHLPAPRLGLRADRGVHPRALGRALRLRHRRLARTRTRPHGGEGRAAARRHARVRRRAARRPAHR